MQRTILTFALAMGLAMDAGAQGAHGAPSACPGSLGGTWRGAGRVANRDVVMVQEWRPAVLGAFTELRMTHRLPADTARVVFEARGFYRAKAASDTVTGTWVDARGYAMTLAGSCREGALVMVWTGETESGRTTYRLANAALEVLDEVRVADGTMRAFGRSRLERVTP